MDPIYLFLHIPRTGGTTVINSVGNHLDRTNDRYLKHYNYVQGYSESHYDENQIPGLIYRTASQQRQLKIVTGHSVFCNSHKWLRVSKEPRIFSVIRDPIERCLSSFNYRYTHSTLTQNPASFSIITPPMNENAYHQKKTVEDYSSLWEYYQDCTFETNVQCKWIVKSFLKRDNNTWYNHPTYIFGPDTGIGPDQSIATTWPEWMFRNTDEKINWFELAQNFFSDMWWLTRTENLNNALPEFCEYIGVEYTGDQKYFNDSKLKHWTLEDVMKQPDIHKLIEAEHYDYQLYEAAKQWKRPF